MSLSARMKLTDYGVEHFALLSIARRERWEPEVMGGFGLAEEVEDRLIALAGFSTYLASALLNHVFRSTKYVAPGTIYFGLNGADPTDAGLNTEAVIGFGSYARASVAVADGSWNMIGTVGAAEVIQNASNVQFNMPTDNWNGGNPITWSTGWDAGTGGNMLVSGALGTPRTVQNGDNSPVFGPASLVMSLA